MTLLSTESMSGGFVRDPDGRLVIAADSAGVPNASSPVTASSGNVAATATTATLAGVAAKTTYITGFEVTGSGATAASVIQVTLTGTNSATTPTFIVTVPAGVTTAVSPLIIEFPSPIPASAVNTVIVVNVPSFGAGNTNASVVAHGYQL